MRKEQLRNVTKSVTSMGMSLQNIEKDVLLGN